MRARLASTALIKAQLFDCGSRQSTGLITEKTCHNSERRATMAKKRQNSKRQNLTNRRESPTNENVDSQNQVSRNIEGAITVPTLNKSYSRKIVVANQDNCREQTYRSSKRCHQARWGAE